MLPVASIAGTNVWTAIGPEGGTVPRLFFNQANPAIVYAATLDSFYRSVNGGVRWERSANPAFSFVVDLTVDPQDSNRVYVLSNDQLGVYRTRLPEPGRAVHPRRL